MGDTLQIERALVVWLGNDTSPWPLRDDAAVIDAFGPRQGAGLLVELRSLESDFYGPPRSEQPLPLADVGRAQLTETRAKVFRQLHPELSDTVVELLSWAHSYDFK